MSYQTTRHKEIAYQYKTISVANNTEFAGAGPTLFLAIPPNVTGIKAINLFAILQFDISTPTEKRKVSHIGGGFGMGLDGKLILPNEKLIEVNQVADTNRFVYLDYDLSHLSSNFIADIINAWDQPSTPFSIITNNDLTTGEATGKIILWKIDIVYTII